MKRSPFSPQTCSLHTSLQTCGYPHKINFPFPVLPDLSPLSPTPLQSRAAARGLAITGAQFIVALAWCFPHLSRTVLQPDKIAELVIDQVLADSLEDSDEGWRLSSQQLLYSQLLNKRVLMRFP